MANILLNDIHITHHDVLQDFLLNKLGQSNEFDEEIRHFMFVHMGCPDRTFELTGRAKGDKVIVTIFEKDGKIFETQSFYLGEVGARVYDEDEVEHCHISGTPVVLEGKGDGIREYDICCECEGKTHPDEMITLPEEDDRMEVCSKCHESESREKLIDALIDQIKSDIEQGDTTVLAEILETKDTNYLKSSLSE